MKAQVLTIAALFGLLMIGAMGCINKHGEEDVKHIEDSLSKTGDNINRNDTNDSKKYTADQRKLLTEYNGKIADLKRDYKKDKKEVSKEYNKDIDKLQQESDILDVRLNQFKYKTEDDWKTFKRGIDRDMDSLGKSISRMAEKNKQENE